MNFIDIDIDPRKLQAAREDYWRPGRGTTDPAGHQNSDGSYTYTLQRDGKPYSETVNLPDPFRHGSFNEKIASENKFFNPTEKYRPDEYFNLTSGEQYDKTAAKLDAAQKEGTSLIEKIMNQVTSNIGSYNTRIA